MLQVLDLHRESAVRKVGNPSRMQRWRGLGLRQPVLCTKISTESVDERPDSVAVARIGGPEASAIIARTL
jgi:hypothetical protein